MANKTNRVCIFAHYDKHDIIDEYVLYYLKGLKNCCDRLVFVSDCNLNENELKKIKGIVSDIIVGIHGEYDFGSYKRGYLLIKDELLQYDELVMCNDSCYAPMNDLEHVFEYMKFKNCDFWGITSNYYGYKKSFLFKNKYILKKNMFHVQSYFMVFSKKVFNSEIFSDFYLKISKLVNKFEIIINYEIGLTEKLISYGFVPGLFIEFNKKERNITDKRWRSLIVNDNPSPFLKVNLIRDRADKDFVKGWEDFLLQNTNYPIELIKNHLARVKK